MKKLALPAVALIFSFNNAAHALGVYNGWYGGLMGGVSYNPSIEALVFTAPTTPYSCITPSTVTSATLDHSVGGGGAIQIGYRLFHRYRLEGEAFGNYNAVNELKFTGSVVKKKSNRLAQTLSMQGQTMMFAGFFNGFIDFNQSQNVGNFAPYVGLGVGYARVSNDVDYWVDANGSLKTDTKCYKVLNESSSHLAGQAIVGLSYLLDSYTSFAFDARYIATSGNNNGAFTNNRNYYTAMFNVLFNVAFDSVDLG